jgi:Transposase DDE domain group 1
VSRLGSEALAGILRPGNAGPDTAADHIQVTHLALAQIPDHERHGQPILIRADGAGASRAWLGHLDQLRTEEGLDLDYSVGFTMTDTAWQAILTLPEHAWTPAVQTDGSLREGASVAELTGMLPDLAARGWPPGIRVIVRRERPHPGAQLTFSDIHGYRFQAFATSTRTGQLAALEARHRAHARAGDRIRTGKDTGYGRFPSRHFQINAVWPGLALSAADLIAWAQTMLLNGGLATAEPRKLRYQLLHTAAASPAGNDEPGSGPARPGPGPATSPQPSPDSRSCPPLPDPPADPSTHHERPGDPGPHAGRSATPSPPNDPRARSNHRTQP